MTNKVVWGIDPSMSHTALVMSDWDGQNLTNWEWYQQDSAPRKKKSGERNYHIDFERMSSIITGWKLFTSCQSRIPDIIHVEAPYGAQSSRAAIGYAVSWMVIAYITTTYKAEVSLHCPRKVKEWATGDKNADKSLMIEAASEYFPDFPWKRNKQGVILRKEEHKADALCTLKYGLESI